MNGKITDIKNISISDFEEIKRLIFSRWPDFEEWFDEDWLRNFLKKGNDYCFKYMSDGKIIGVILGTKHRESAYVRAILVTKKRRREGIGGKLLRSVEQIARRNNLKTVYLDSGERDYGTGAFQFYNRCDYHVVGHANIHGEILIFFEKEI